jgi:hypothetical protein
MFCAEDFSLVQFWNSLASFQPRNLSWLVWIASTGGWRKQIDIDFGLAFS